MKLRWVAVLCVLLFTLAAAYAQTPAAIEKAELSGISADTLSSGLRTDLQKLTGQPYDEKVAGQFAERIQAELPEYVVNATTATGSEPGRVRLIFVVAHNVNSKYIVESVVVKDTDKSKFSDSLWADMQAMVGHPVDDAKADELKERISAELKKQHLRRSVVRGSDSQHVRIEYEAPGQNSVGFSGTGGYHSRQKFSGRGTVSYSFYDFLGVQLDGINDSSRLIERYAGFQYGAWTSYKRVRFNANYSSFRAQWSPGTTQAAATSGTSADLYRLRDTIEPSVKFTVTPGLKFTVGVTASQLQMQVPVSHFESVRTANGNAEFSFYLTSSEAHRISGTYDIRVAGDTLGGSASFTRHLWDQTYSYKFIRKDQTSKSALGENQIYFKVKLGRTTGSAPMFERFALGQPDELLGWNKYDISPLGTNRIAYGAITYHNDYFITSFESGSVWNSGQPSVYRNDIVVRLLLGNIFHAPGPLRFILNAAMPGIGIPLGGKNIHPIFTLGGSS